MTVKCVNWSDYEKCPHKHRYKTVYVKNCDFKYGTLRIVEPCTIKLKEDIIFNPDNGDGSNKYFEPNLSKKKHRYTSAAYILGFFAAIAVETKNVTIDLNGHTISQSNKHYILQRFYAHIELADQPFITKQGPGEFGETTDSAHGCTIKNGYLGLSSHHGIHGNNNKCIRIENLNIHTFEVAGIALNGVIDLHVCDVCIDGKTNVVEVLGIFSAAVFLRKFAKLAIKYAQNNNAKNDLQNKLNDLENAIDNVVNDITNNCSSSEVGEIDPNRDSTKIFKNQTRIPDGTTYGIVINKKGVAVNAFTYKRPDVYQSKNIKMHNVKIKNIIGFTNEIIALSSGENATGESYNNAGVQTDTAGAVFQILECLNPDTELYEKNVVSEMQLAIARWSDDYLTGSDPKLIHLRKQGRFGTLNIKSAVVAWGFPGVSYDVDGFTIDSNTKFSDVMDVTGIKYLGNGDSMFHVNKGFFGIRLDSVYNVSMNVKICKVKNESEKGSDLPGPYIGYQDGGHLSQSKMIGYTGTDSYGIIASGCEKVNINKSKIKCIHSKNGSSFGIKINGETKDLDMNNSRLYCISTLSDIHANMPNKVSKAFGACVEDGCLNINLKNNNIKKIKAKKTYVGYKYVIDNDDTKLCTKL